MNSKIVKVLKLGGDIGNSFSDFVGENNYTDKFDSCLVENKGKEREDSGNTLAINGKHYSIGQGSLTAATIQDRNLGEYEALACTGICRYLKTLKVDTFNNDVEIQFCIGLPTGDYSEYKQVYKELFSNKLYDVKYSGISYKFKINKIMVVPQGAVITATNSKIFEGVRTGFIIDFGSYTFDVQEVVQGKLSKQNKRSYENGILRCLGGLYDILKVKGVTVTEEKDIEAFIVDGRIRTKYQDEDKKFLLLSDPDIQNYFDKEISKIADKANNHFASLKASTKTYVLGGGAVAFSSILKKKFNDVIIPVNADKVNAVAYYSFCGGK